MPDAIVPGAIARVGVILVASISIAASSARAEALPVAGARRVDGIAAVVGGRAPGEGVIAILRSDVALRARVALAGGGLADPETAPLPASLLRATLDEQVGEALIAVEAARLGLAEPSDAEVRQACSRLAVSTGSQARFQAILRALAVDEAEVLALCRRRAIVGRFLAANLQGTLDPTPAELERAYREGGHPFFDQPVEETREQFQVWFNQQRTEQAVRSWVAALRQRIPFRILADFELP